MAPMFFISVEPDKTPLQSVLPSQVAVISTLHGSVCANAEVGKPMPATMRHKHPKIKLCVFLVFICSPLLSSEFSFMSFAENNNPPSAHKLIEALLISIKIIPVVLFGHWLSPF